MLFTLVLSYLLVLVSGQDQNFDESWYSMGDDWDTSDHLMEDNPFYATTNQIRKQMNMYGFAKHVGKINRGKMANPGLNMPVDRAFGYEHDFNPGDLTSGAFTHQPGGQRVHANQGHVNQGLATQIGQVLTTPAGIKVNPDGSILVQTPRSDNPCQPNPCLSHNVRKCDVVSLTSVRCSRSGMFDLKLHWYGPLNEGPNDLEFALVPTYNDGSDFCDDLTTPDEYLVTGDDEMCGVIAGAEDDGPTFTATLNEVIGEEAFTLTNLSDGSSYLDFTYAVSVLTSSALVDSMINLDIYYEGVLVSTVGVPQYDGFVDPNPDSAEYYFFGCFRPGPFGRELDTSGAGFYDEDTEIYMGFDIFEAGLCNALLQWNGGLGFNYGA